MRTFREYLEAILVAVLLALFVKAFAFELFQIPSPSMETNLLVGDHIVVNKFVYAPHAGPWARFLPYRDVARGDVFVFKYPADPTRDFIKRAVAVGGDTIEVAGARVLRNGVALAEPYAVHLARGEAGDDRGPARRFGPFTVPAGAYFAMGDNRDNSRDSRFWGPVPTRYLKGRAVAVYWSVEPAPALHAERGAAVRRLLDGAVHFFERTRWRRTFQVVR